MFLLGFIFFFRDKHFPFCLYFLHRVSEPRIIIMTAPSIVPPVLTVLSPVSSSPDHLLDSLSLFHPTTEDLSWNFEFVFDEFNEDARRQKFSFRSALLDLATRLAIFRTLVTLAFKLPQSSLIWKFINQPVFPVIWTYSVSRKQRKYLKSECFDRITDTQITSEAIIRKDFATHKFLIFVPSVLCHSELEYDTYLNGNRFADSFLLKQTGFRMDLHDVYKRKPSDKPTIFEKLFLRPEQIVTTSQDYLMNFQAAPSQHLEDHDEIMDFVHDRHNQNFINLNSEWYWGHPGLMKMIDKMKPQVDFGVERILDTAVLLLNNILGIYMSKSACYYVVKIQQEVPISKDKTEMRMTLALYSDISKLIPQLAYTFHTLTTTDSDGKERKSREKQENLFNHWIKSPKHAIIHSLVFEPWRVDRTPTGQEYGSDPDVDPYVYHRRINTFTKWGFDWETCERMSKSDHGKTCVKIVRDLIMDVFCDGNDEYFGYFTKWVASLFQRPAEKNKVFSILLGQYGIGKGLFSKFLSLIYAAHFFFDCGGSPNEKFNAHHADMCFIWFDEMQRDLRKDNKTKGFTTEDEQTIEAKGIDKRKAWSRINMLGCTNEDLIIPTSDSERRYFILECRNFTMVELQKHRDLTSQQWDIVLEHPTYGNKGVAAIFHYFMKVDLTNWHAWHPSCYIKTKYLKKLIEDNLSICHDWWNHVLKRGGLEIDPTTRDREYYIDEKRTYTWYDLYLLFRQDENYKTVRGVNFKIINQATFEDQLRDVIATSKPVNPAIVRKNKNSFILGKTAEQIYKWYHVHPDIRLDLDFSKLGMEDPFSRAMVASIQQDATRVSGQLSNWHQEEKEAALEQLKSQLATFGLSVKFADRNENGYTSKLAEIVVKGERKRILEEIADMSDEELRSYGKMREEVEEEEELDEDEDVDVVLRPAETQTTTTTTTTTPSTPTNEISKDLPTPTPISMVRRDSDSLDLDGPQFTDEQLKVMSEEEEKEEEPEDDLNLRAQAKKIKKTKKIRKTKTKKTNTSSSFILSEPDLSGSDHEDSEENEDDEELDQELKDFIVNDNEDEEAEELTLGERRQLDKVLKKRKRTRIEYEMMSDNDDSDVTPPSSDSPSNGDQDFDLGSKSNKKARKV